LPLSQHLEMAISAMHRKQEHGCSAGSESLLKLLVLDVQVHILLHDCSSVGNPWRVIVFPDVLDLVGGFAFNHGHFHDLSELAGTGVSE
jgi:hypothetical protein